jgi:hypothetical protein
VWSLTRVRFTGSAYNWRSDSASPVTIDDATSARLTGRVEQQRPMMPEAPTTLRSVATRGWSSLVHLFRPNDAQLVVTPNCVERLPLMNHVKTVCIVVLVVVITAAAVIAVGTVIRLSSWELL